MRFVEPGQPKETVAEKYFSMHVCLVLELVYTGTILISHATTNTVSSWMHRTERTASSLQLFVQRQQPAFNAPTRFSETRYTGQFIDLRLFFPN